MNIKRTIHYSERERYDDPRLYSEETNPDFRPEYLDMVEFVKTINRTAVSRTTGKERKIRLLPLSVMQIELRDLVRRWMDSGPNLRVMFKKDKELAERAKYGKTILYPGPSGRGHLEWSPRTPESHLASDKFDFRSDKDRALREFITLITNPYWDLLSGPCLQCNKYFLKTSNRNRTYCSKGCGARHTAYASTKARRDAIQEERIRKVQKATAEWGRRRRRISWRQWVEQDPGITSSWLTRHINAGHIVPPKEESKIRTVESSIA